MLVNSYIFKKDSIDITNLKAYYTMEGNANDIVGGHNGTVTNGSFVTGKIGQGFSGDGNQDYIRTPANAVFNMGNGSTETAFSWDGWFKFNDNGQQAWLICKRNTGTGNQDFDLQFYETGLYWAVYSDGATSNYFRVSYPWTPTVGEWYHIATSYDASKTAAGMKLYVNGVDVGTSAVTGTYNNILGNNTPVTIGAFSLQLTSTTRSFDGVTDNVKLWHEVLTPEKIAAIIAKEESGQLITV